MEKRFIKMNTGKDYLSLGNLFNIIKDTAYNKMSAMQVELFCVLFEIDGINSTTVNNYCIGCRAIGIEYKKIYYDLKEIYNKDKEIFINKIINLLSILDEHIYTLKESTIDFINRSNSLKKVCEKLILLSKEDDNVNNELIDKVNNFYNSNNLYECFIEFLFYIILNNRQPLFIKRKLDVNQKELEEYMNIKLYEGISYITSLIQLSKKNNMYANAELGSLEFSGYISGKEDFKKCFEYYLKAAEKNHPKACWMVANLILTGRYGNIERDFKILWKYLNKSIELGSSAGLNTMGLCYLKGINPEKIIDEKKALEYFFKAGDLGYSFAFNNISLIYEKKGDSTNALKYLKLSADLEESWALNKLGEYYRKKGDLINAYFYYLKSSEAPQQERNYYSYYNLAIYYYLVGNKELNIKKDINKAYEFLNIAFENGVVEALKYIKK